ncbi:MAG TPA: hypothetical protein VFU10_11925 [Gaiellaceae bacterium]|nr:hypothetical protein [Gaiellaceae bacterium]
MPILVIVCHSLGTLSEKSSTRTVCSDVAPAAGDARIATATAASQVRRMVL